ncbi:hypothetical protein [Flavobacterium beibuense]|uniref:hypothetical protein n=1 Tax=Flavobacterium beibuense TaxID=657326 RepID=UPI003A93967C
MKTISLLSIISLRSIVLIFLFTIPTIQIVSGQDCSTITESGVFDPNSDVLITSYHQSMAKTTTGYVTWGEDMAANGGDANSITEITPANGYNYVGDPIHFAVSGNSGGQAFLATTTSLYVWGGLGEVVDGSFATGGAFNDMNATQTLPFIAANITQMHASSDVLFVVSAGEIWVATTGTTAPSGNSSTNGNVWQQVQTSSGIALNNVVNVTGNKYAGYALLANGDIYTWGNNVVLGNGTAAQNLNYATQMITPMTTIEYITSYTNDANDTGLLALGADTKIYGIGANTAYGLITNGTGIVTSWTAIQAASGGDFTGALQIATSHTSEQHAGAAVLTAGATPGSTNLLYTWGRNSSNSIGHTTGTVADPTIPPSFNVGTDDPVSVSVGGHATTFFNRANGGSICFVGHIISGSTGGLTEGDGSSFECIIPASIELCGAAPPDPCNPIASGNIDSDGDGVSDVCDLDDDNDGVLDANEGCGSSGGLGNIDLINNFSPGQIDVGNNGSYVTTISDVTASYTFIENGSDIEVVDLSGTGQQGPVFKFTGKKNKTASIDIVFSEYVLGSYFKLTDFDENEKVTVNVYDHNGTLINLAGSPYIEALGSQVSQDSNTFSTYFDPTNTNGDNVSSDPVGSVVFNFTNQLISRINVGIVHARDSSIRFTQVQQFCIPMDTDNDGIPNFLDTDSDNDGCFDALEAAGNITTDQLDTNGMITGGVDENGVPTAVSGGQNTTDAVAINEIVTISSITSNISGVVCSGTAITYTANATGTRVTDFSTNPYTTEALDPSEINYQWYESTDGGATFTILSGETNSTLTLTNVQVADPVKQYKVLASSANNSCGTEDATSLTVVNEADLSLVKTVYADQNATGAEIEQANIGDTIYYKIVLTNNGPCDATTSVKDVLPAGVSYIATSSTVPASTTFAVDDSSNIGMWNNITVASGSTQTLVIAVLVGPNCGDITNFAEVETSTRPDPNSIPGNRS